VLAGYSSSSSLKETSPTLVDFMAKMVKHRFNVASPCLQWLMERGYSFEGKHGFGSSNV